MVKMMCLWWRSSGEERSRERERERETIILKTEKDLQFGEAVFHEVIKC